MRQSPASNQLNCLDSCFGSLDKSACDEFFVQQSTVLANWRGSVCTSPHLSRLRAGRLAQVSHLWRDVTASDLLWRPLWEAQYQRPLTEQEEAAVGAGCSFKRLFAEAQVRRAHLRSTWWSQRRFHKRTRSPVHLQPSD